MLHFSPVGLFALSIALPTSAVFPQEETAEPVAQEESEETAEEVELTPAILAAEISQHVRTLAADDMEGRRTGEPGSHRASDYIAKALAQTGVPPAGDEGSYFQRVPLVRVTYKTVPQLRFVDADGGIVESTPGADYTWSGTRPFSAKAEGFLHVKSPGDVPTGNHPNMALYLDLERKESREVLRGGELTKPGRFAMILARGSSDPGEEINRPPNGGWLAFFETAEDGTRTPLSGTDVPRSTAIWLRGVLPDRLTTLLESDSVEGLSPEFLVEMELEDVMDRNVVAILPGVGTEENPELAKETIVFSAHFDHNGARPREPWEAEDEDVIMNGADDDASGVASVLELAAHYAASETPPVRTLVFLLATGEEVGLLGTKWYLKHPVRPLSNTILNLNFEMLGRPDEEAGGAGIMWLTGHKYTTLGDVLLGGKVVDDKRPDMFFFQRSDNYAFVQLGIVGQTLSSYNLHRDYHQVTDEADLCDFDHMESCVQAAFAGMKKVVAGEAKPEWREGVDPFEL